MMKTRTQKFEDKYKRCAGAVLKSIACVARAGRTRDPLIIAAERWRHFMFMQMLP